MRLALRLGACVLLIGTGATLVSAQSAKRIPAQTSTRVPDRIAPPPVDIELLINRGQLPEARAALAGYRTRTRADSAQTFYWRGRIALSASSLDEAVRLLEKSVQLGPKVGHVHYWLAIGYVRTALGKSRMQQPLYARRVRTSLERATALTPGLIDARLYLIQYYLRAPYLLGGSKEKARAQADTILQLDPLSGHLARAQVAEASGDLATAEREFSAAVRDYPKDETGYNALGGFYRRTQQYGSAVEIFQRLQRVQPANALLHLQIGRTMAEWGQQLDRGTSELETALAMGLGPQDAASAHYHMGLIYQRRGDGARAQERFNRALALDPAMAQALAARRSVQ